MLLKTRGGPGGVGAVTAVEVIVVLNQWNMYGPAILSCVMNITVGESCAYANGFLIREPKDLGA